jgi:hypothetical protein
MKRLLFSGILLVMLLMACAPLPAVAPSLVPGTPTSVSSAVRADTPAETPSVPAVTPTLLVFPTPTSQPSPTASAATTVVGLAEPVETPTPEFVEAPRLPAEKWQEWPVIPALTRVARDTYIKGLAMGTNPHAFAKVGDCQCVNAAFFGIYDQPGAYAFPKGYEYLQETIDWFAGYFNRDSAAVRSGFNVASVFGPLQADPTICRSGETPLACEFRATRPSIVLISMETGFEGRTAAVYEKYMRQIIEYALQQGALPILATKADNFEGDQSINLTTAKLAVEYDLPLWNFWRAVQPLPEHGMDDIRNDKFHISVEAWNVRSFTGLQALDAMWRAVRDER